MRVGHWWSPFGKLRVPSIVEGLKALSQSKGVSSDVSACTP